MSEQYLERDARVTPLGARRWWPEPRPALHAYELTCGEKPVRKLERNGRPHLHDESPAARGDRGTLSLDQNALSRCFRTAPAPRDLAAAELFGLGIRYIELSNAFASICERDTDRGAFPIRDLAAREV
jgi:hypothetical protein